MNGKGNPQDTACLVRAAVAGLVLAVGAGTSAFADEDNDGKEKCYGVAKAGGNDCATATSVCTGHSTEDGQRDAWLWLPKGTCERLVGGRARP
jgi:uncharacterized membrane protein